MGHTRQWRAEVVREQIPKQGSSWRTQTQGRGPVIRGMWPQKTVRSKVKAGAVMRRGGQGEGTKDLILCGGPVQDHARHMLTSLLTSNLQTTL